MVRGMHGRRSGCRAACANEVLVFNYEHSTYAYPTMLTQHFVLVQVTSIYLTNTRGVLVSDAHKHLVMDSQDQCCSPLLSKFMTNSTSPGQARALKPR